MGIQLLRSRVVCPPTSSHASTIFHSCACVCVCVYAREYVCRYSMRTCMRTYTHTYIHTYAHMHACTHTNGNPRHFSPAPFPSTPAASPEAFSSSTRWMRHRSISKPPDALRTLSFQLRARSRPPPSITGPTCPQRHTRKHTRKRTRTQSDMVSYESYMSHTRVEPELELAP